MSATKRILLVGFNPLHEQLVRESVQAARLPFQILATTTLPQAIGCLKRKKVRLILSEYLSISDPDNWIGRYTRTSNAPVIILTTRDDENGAVKCMKAGASDFYQKSEDTLRKLPDIIKKSLSGKHKKNREQAPGGINLIRHKLKNLTDMVAQYPQTVTRLRGAPIDIPKELENIKSMIKNFMK